MPSRTFGIALQGQEEYSKAAVAYIEAIRICPRDGRALNLLEELVSRKGEHILDIGHITAELWRCRDLVEQAVVH